MELMAKRNLKMNCFTAKEIMTIVPIIYREAQHFRRLQQIATLRGNEEMAKMCEGEFMKLTRLTNRMAEVSRRENYYDITDTTEDDY